MKKIVIICIGFLVIFGCRKSSREGVINQVESDGVTISYLHYHIPNAKTIVFIHGWSCDNSYWSEQVDFYKNDYNVVAIDLGGHGASGNERDEWTIYSFAQDVIRVLESIEYQELILVGHSMGSMVVIDVAAQLDNPSITLVCVDYLKQKLVPLPEVFVNQMVQPFEADFINSAKGLVASFFPTVKDSVLYQRILNYMSASDPAIAIPAMKDLVMRDYREQFEKLRTYPKKFIINSDASPIDDSHFESLGFITHVVDNSGHFLMLEESAKFNEILSLCLN